MVADGQRIRLPYAAMQLMRAAWRTAAAIVAVCALLWTAAIAGIYAAMRQPPERFGAMMAHVPVATMLVLPFKPLWMSARAGDLRIGDRAPDFSLPLLHGDRLVTLSEEHARKPVVLVFGSYT
jgi:hypothetical protein